MIDRIDLATAGFWVLQDFDVTDMAAPPNNYDYTGAGIAGLPINFGARFGFTKNSRGLPQWGALQGTVGPIGQWLYWPPAASTGGRVMGQWGQNFAAQITSTSPLQATAIKKGDGTLDSSLAALTVSFLGSTSPALNSFGLVVAGTDLSSFQPIFFQGGSGGGGMSAFSIDSGSNPYTAHQIDLAADPTGGTSLAGGVTTSALYEMNSSSVLAPTTNVFAQLFGSNWMICLPMKTCT